MAAEGGGAEADAPVAAPPRPGPAGERERPGYHLSVAHLTWNVVILELQAAGRPPVFTVREDGDVWHLLDEVDAGRLDEEYARIARSRARRTLRRVRPPADLATASLVGIEHEYVVIGPEGDPVDFKALLPTLDLDGIRADPTDPNAVRCRWGGAVTADGIEAEVVTPPVPVRPGGVDEAVRLAADGRAWLAERLPDGHRLEGFSTHLSVNIPRRRDLRVAKRWCRTFAPALAMLLDRPDSPGLLVRPRPGRLELCGEFCDGEALAVALTFAVGATLALEQWTRTERRSLELHVRTQPSRQRFGFFLAPDAWGGDLYADGRAAVLEGREGPVRAGDHLVRCWAEAAPRASTVSSREELERVERLVAGDEPLPGRSGSTGASTS